MSLLPESGFPELPPIATPSPRHPVTPFLRHSIFPANLPVAKTLIQRARVWYVSGVACYGRRVQWIGSVCVAIVEIAGWTVEVDIPTTRDFYASRPSWVETCGCAYCSNFVSACNTGRLPEQLRATLESLGIDPSRDEGEIWQYNENDDGTHSYGGFYHVVGSIVSENPSPEDWSAEDNIHFLFSTKLDLLSADFPHPAIQIEFAANIPWLLPESPES